MMEEMTLTPDDGGNEEMQMMVVLLIQTNYHHRVAKTPRGWGGRYDEEKRCLLYNL